MITERNFKLWINMVIFGNQQNYQFMLLDQKD